MIALVLLALMGAGGQVDADLQTAPQAEMVWMPYGMIQPLNGCFAIRFVLCHLDKEQERGVSIAYPYRSHWSYYNNRIEQITRRRFFEIFDRTNLPAPFWYDKEYDYDKGRIVEHNFSKKPAVR